MVGSGVLWVGGGADVYIRKMKQKINIYQCKEEQLTGHRYVDVLPRARSLFRGLQRRTKRRPYIRSAYFQKEKIFIGAFWTHILQKLPSDQARRLKLLPCALEVIRKSRNDPVTFIDPTQTNSLLHRFYGKSPDGRLFCVQVKQDKRSGKKRLLSAFPIKKSHP